MASERFKRDLNHFPAMGGVTDDALEETHAFRLHPTTKYQMVHQNTLDSSTDSVSIVGGATTPTFYAITVAAANTEYPQALPSNAKDIKAWVVDGDGFPIGYGWKVYFQSGASTYAFLPGNASYEATGKNITSGTIYVQVLGGTATAIVEVWT